MRKVSEGGDSVNEWSVIMYPDKELFKYYVRLLKLVQE